MNQNQNQNIEMEEYEPIEPDANVEVIGVKFKDAGKVYYFSPAKIDFEVGDKVIVKTARGIEFGFVAGCK